MYALFPNQSLLTQYLSHTELPTASVITQVFLPLVPLSQMFPLGGQTSLHPSDLNLNFFEASIKMCSWYVFPGTHCFSVTPFSHLTHSPFYPQSYYSTYSW